MFGSIVLTLALASSVLAMVMYFLNYRGNSNTLNYGRLFYHIMSMLVIIASTYLLYAILTHQYQFKYIYSYSNSDLPLGLLMATFYAGQEGSFMLWLLLTAIVGLILQSYTSKRGDLEPRVMAVFTLATSFLLLMVSPMFKDPFAYIWSTPVFLDLKNINSAFLQLPFINNFLFSDNSTGQHFIKMDSDLYSQLSAAGVSINEFIRFGKGLNPLLQNFWMQIHPPILFIGFSMATVPFTFAIAALMKNDYSEWVKQSLPWVISGAGVLGLGIMLGGYWAYGVLGWGGYWAWDPVENSSLVPWLVGVASIHTLLAQKKGQSVGKHKIGKYAKTNLVLCIMTYVLVLYSTFLTRSGVLGDASVHSFVAPGELVYLFLVIFISSFMLLGFGFIAYRWNSLNAEIDHEESLLSRELSLFTASVVLIASSIIVLVGTSAPIFGQTVHISFYDEMHIPIAIIIGFLNGLSLLLKWKHTDGKEIIKKSLFSGVSSVILTILIIVFGAVYDLMMILLTLSASFALIVNGEIAFKIIKGNKKMLGAYVSHIGIALFILGVIGSSVYDKEVDIDLVKNQPKETLGRTLTFLGFEPIEDGKKFAFLIDVKKGNKSAIVKPVMYVSEFNNSLMREPDIITGWTSDFYVSPLGYEDGGSGDSHGHAHQHFDVGKGNSIEFEGAKITFVDYIYDDATMSAMMSGGDFELAVDLKVEYQGKSYNVYPALKSDTGNRFYTNKELPEVNLKIELENLDASGTIRLALSNLEDTDSQTITTSKAEILSVTASTKPFVNLVWIGIIVLTLGFFVAAARRTGESQK